MLLDTVGLLEDTGAARQHTACPGNLPTGQFRTACSCSIAATCDCVCGQTISSSEASWTTCVIVTLKAEGANEDQRMWPKLQASPVASTCVRARPGASAQPA